MENIQYILIYTYMWTFRREHYSPDFEGSFRPSRQLSKSSALEKNQHSWTLFVVCLMVFNATFNNISVISWRSVLLVEETGRPEENHRPVTSQRQTFITQCCTIRPDRDIYISLSSIIVYLLQFLNVQQRFTYLSFWMK